MIPARQRALTLALLAVAALAAPSRAAAPPPATDAPHAASAADPVVARVGDATVTASELTAEMARRSAGDPAAFAAPRTRRALLDEMVATRVRVEAARRAGYLSDPRIATAIDRMLAAALEDDWRRAHAGELEVRDEDVRTAWAARRAEYALAERRQIALVEIAVPRGGNAAAARATAEDLRRQALALPASTPHFGALAARSDDGGTRYVGGVAGWVVAGSRYRWPDALVAAAFSLPAVGAISPVIEAGGGFWLVRLLAIDPARDRTFDEVRPALRSDLRRERERTLRAAWQAELARQVGVAIDEAALGAVTPPPVAPPPVPAN